VCSQWFLVAMRLSMWCFIFAACIADLCAGFEQPDESLSHYDPIGAVALSFLTVRIDTISNAKWVRATGWIWAGGSEDARNVLATIAGSTITVAGVVFSVTIVALTLASSQYGPRLLRNFMADRPTQFVLGVFVATFLYCLLVLRTLRGTDVAAKFVPFLSVTCGLVFAVISVAFSFFSFTTFPARSWRKT
jgi:uncharacterized membrane protein